MTKTMKRMKQATDDYLDLIRRFPLRPIRSDREYDQAVELLDELVGRADDPGLCAGESDYADALGYFIDAYEKVHFPVGRKLSPVEALWSIMEQTDMNTADLGRLLGSGTGHASLIVNGKRELSKANIRKLAEHFHVSAALFI